MSAVSGETEQVVVAPGVRPPLAVPRRLLRMRSDAALAERFAAGDESAFDVIYERHRPVVLAVCMGVLGAPPDAEDATQETFSALAVALRTRPPAELRPWLIRVARNASIDTTRRRRHRLLTLDGEIPEIAARPASTGKAELAVVLDGIRELPEGQRMALLMRELGGHSYSEIAEFLETDEESVKGLIARARVGLRTYREATELSCASARTTIAAEPDGRRYDKTIRRHLRTCGSCRSYREALRDDAKALRAALPIQAGTVATGSLSSGLLSTAKGSLLGYGLTQAATTCAASACAVGAIGGMVFVAPVHKLGLLPILPPAKTAPAHKHHAAATRAPASHVVVTPTQAAPIVSGSAPAPEHSSVAPRSVVSSAWSPSTGAAVTRHRHHEPTLTRVKLAPLPPVHRSAPVAPPVAATVAPAAPAAPAATEPAPSVPAATTPAPSTVTPATQTGQPQGAGHPTGDPNSQTGSGGGSQSGSGQGSQAGGDHGTHSGGDAGSGVGGHLHGNPVHVIVGGAVHAVTPTATASASAASASSEAPPAPAAATATAPSADATVPVGATTTTSAPTYTRPVVDAGHGPAWGHDHSGTRHTAGWHQAAPVQPASPASPTTGTSPAATAPTVTSATSSTSPVSSSTEHGWSGGSPQTWRVSQPGATTSPAAHGTHWGRGGR